MGVTVPDEDVRDAGEVVSVVKEVVSGNFLITGRSGKPSDVSPGIPVSSGACV